MTAKRRIHEIMLVRDKEFHIHFVSEGLELPEFNLKFTGDTHLITVTMMTLASVCMANSNSQDEIEALKRIFQEMLDHAQYLVDRKPLGGLLQ